MKALFPWRAMVCPIVALTAGSVMAADILMQPMLPSGTVACYQRCQWRIDTGRSYAHPFDPDQVSVDACFRAPDGAVVIVPAFWDEPSAAAPGFYVRFAPPRPGQWWASVVVKDDAGLHTAIGGSFTVGPANTAGFIRRASNNRYLQYDSGASFFPVGLNLCWARGPSAASWFDRMFTILASNGGNYARVWMCHPPVKLEGEATGLNTYSLPSATFFDDMLAAGEAHGVAVMLTFLNHREFIDRDMWGAADWGRLPYNAARGGPATRPIDFFTNAEARRLFKARLRYIVARYSAYRSVAFWEFFNEQENTNFPIPNSWNAEMATYLRQIDPVKHLITTSAGVPAEVWREPEIDLTQTHVYGDGTPSDLVAAISQAQLNHQMYSKPHLIGEMGLDFKGGDEKFDPHGKGTAFHNSLWSAMTTGNAGAAAYWWWDGYIEPLNLWHEFTAVAAVAKTVDWAHGNYRPIHIDDLSHSDANGLMTDLSILPSGGWGDTTRETVVVPENGRPHVSPARFLYGGKHTDLSVPLTFDLTLPQGCTLRLIMSQVSDFAVVRVSVDDQPLRDLFFDALPGAPGTSHSEFKKEHGIYVANIDQPIELPMPAGHHRITLHVQAGDWVTMSNIVFTGALDPKFANLAAFAVQDFDSQDTLLWLWDTRSNWKQDQSTDPAPQDSDVRLVVPTAAGAFRCEWFDTRSGQSIARQEVTASGPGLALTAPPFTRDVALRVSRMK